jgi:hypothetical protein
MPCLESSESTDTEESVLDQTFDGDMESVVEVENQSVGSSSTGLLGMQGVRPHLLKWKNFFLSMTRSKRRFQPGL